MSNLLDTGKPVASVHSNSMVAHTWAQLAVSDGRSNNGQFYFSGRRLFSYGAHYVAGYILPRPGADSHGRGVTLVNEDSYSPTTGKHTGLAFRAARGAVSRVPSLTRLAELFESGLARSVHAGGTSPYDHASAGIVPGRPLDVDWNRMAEEMGPALKEFFSVPENWPGLETAESIFRAAACDNPERRARAAMDAMVRVRDKARAERDKRVREGKLREAKKAAATPIADILAEMESDAARKLRPSGWMTAAELESEWNGKARAINRAGLAAKDRGWTSIHRACLERYRAIRAEAATWEERVARGARLHYWRGYVSAFRAGMAAIESRHDTPELVEGRRAVSSMAHALQFGRAGKIAAALGHDVDAMINRLQRDSESMGHALAEVQARLAEEQARASLDTARIGMDTLNPDSLPPEERVRRLDAGARAIRPYANRRALYPNDGDTGPLVVMPKVWTDAGWTPELAKDRADRMAELSKSLRTDIAEAKERARKEAEEQARHDWRGGLSGTYDVDGRRQRVTTCPDGGAMLRAVDVKRGETGTITGGFLETSQGASVPLVDAIRVFRFLKHCRTTGQSWRRNGRTLRAGVFDVDSIQPSGDFIAGCHRIRWNEVQRLAQSLGLAGLLPEDTTEERASA